MLFTWHPRTPPSSSALKRSAQEYRQKCLVDYQDVLTVSHTVSYHHYTLYYQDRAGNLVRTVPPAGKGPDMAARTAHPAHTLETRYAYNSLKQLVRQETPDGGVSEFLYDAIGRLRFSRNAKQVAEGTYSYTRYDELGRIVEVGQGEMAGLPVGETLADQVDDDKWPFAGTQRTRTTYTAGDPWQTHLRNRVSKVGNDDGAVTRYSYDAHGNVQEIRSLVPGLKEKRMLYEYDLYSGKVTKVSYQPGEVDRFYVRYGYDQDNRITQVETSRDGVIWDRDARYDYYTHGALERMLLGEDRVQGVDYVYNTQGWLKALNHPALEQTSDPGQDGLGAANWEVGRDAWGMVLGYHEDDFVKAGSAFNSNTGNPWHLDPALAGYAGYDGLFNGNIATWTERAADWNPDFAAPHLEYGSKHSGTVGRVFRYDQLNRIKDAQHFERNAGASWAATGDYREQFSYDANGNILTLKRDAFNNAVLSPPAVRDMDDLTYHYTAGTNRLDHVEDAMSAANWDNDIDAQAISNYIYDEIGQLVSDASEEFEVEWNVYNKVTKVTWSDPGAPITEVRFLYDAMQRRVGKEVDKPGTSADEAWRYQLDATGNVMAVYHEHVVGTDRVWELTEQPIYGSSRLGMRVEEVTVHKEPVGGGAPTLYLLAPGQKVFYRTVTDRHYELADHLGNVRVVVTDRKLSDVSFLGVPDGFSAEAVRMAGYYAFGSEMVGMVASSEGYRYGFNGMEKVDEVLGEGNGYDFGARVYDGRLGRWWKPDLMEAESPSWSPFRSAYNNPVRYVDINGNFEIDAVTAAKYPRLNAYLKTVATVYAGKPEAFRQAFKQYSELSDCQIDRMLEYKLVPNGTPVYLNQENPRIIVSDLSSVSANAATYAIEKLDESGNQVEITPTGIIALTESMINFFEKDHETYVEEIAAELYLESTLFHEGTHYGDFSSDQLSTQTVKNKGTEGGEAFENAVYGANIGSSDSATPEASIAAVKDYVRSHNYKGARSVDIARQKAANNLKHYTENEQTIKSDR